MATLSKTAGLLLSVLFLACSSSTSGSWSQLPDPSIDIRGHYEWLDAHELSTGCLVDIFIQDERYRGWVIDDQDHERVCQWRGFELSRFEVRGFEVRVSIGCPRAGCPGDARGGAGFILTAVPGVSLTGRRIGGSRSWREDVRWSEMTLVYLKQVARQ